ncbi:hypothetical protein ACE4XC_12925 [Enterococcus faecalis]
MDTDQVQTEVKVTFPVGSKLKIPVTVKDKVDWVDIINNWRPT